MSEPNLSSFIGSVAHLLCGGGKQSGLANIDQVLEGVTSRILKMIGGLSP